MTDAAAMEALTSRDLDRAHESLYYAARRYCAITEESFLQGASRVSPKDAGFVRIGDAAEDLVEAGQRYDEAYASWEKYLPRPDEDDPA